MSTGKTSLEQRREILSHIEKFLEPHPHVYALWLEGADASNKVDEFSDIDLWLDVEDGYEEIVLKQIEQYLNELIPLGSVYRKPDFHPQIKQGFFHLTGMSEFLIVDVCVQSHSREFEFSSSDPVKIIFDKANVIRFAQNSEKVDVLNQAKSLQSQVTLYRVWALKALKRSHWLEALSYYHECILQPLVNVLRLRYTPDKAEYGFKHSDEDLPRDVVAKLESLTKVTLLQGLEAHLDQAVTWLNAVVKEIELKNHES